MSDSPHVVDSLDEFPPESLDLYSSIPGQGLDDTGNLLAIVPASLVSDARTSSALPSRSWHRRRRRWFSATRATGIFRRRDRVRRPAQQLRTAGTESREVASAQVTNASVARQRRRARIRRAISEAAGRNRTARIATVTQLTSVLARAVAISSASVMRRLRLAMQSVAAVGHSVSLRVHAIAESVAYVIGHAVGASVAATRAFIAMAAPILATWRARFARRATDTIKAIPSAGSVAASVRSVRQHTVAAVRLASRLLHARLLTAAASRTRFTRYLREAVNSVANARAVPVRVRHVSPRVIAAVRLAGRMLHPRSVAVAGAMLALIAIAGPVNIIDMSAGRAVPPAEPAAAATAPIEPAVPAPKMVDVGAPVGDRSPTAQATVANASVAPTAPAPVVTRDQRLARPDLRGIQAVLNRYRDAVSTQNVTAVRSVWPDANLDALQKEFAGVREQNVEFEGCRISGAGTGALASCAGVIESGFKPGDRRPRVERRRWQFTLRRSGQHWRIVEVHTQQG